MLTATTKELLGGASRLSQALGGGVSCALLGTNLGSAPQGAVAHGADTVYVADNASLEHYQTGTYLPIVMDLIAKDSAKVALLGQTSLGRDLAPRLATRLQSVAAMDALELEVVGDRVKVTRSCYGGSARQVLTIKTDPQVITVRAKSQDALPADSGRSGSIEQVTVGSVMPRATFVSKEVEESEGVRLDEAEIVISGGRGLGTPDAFRDLERIAKMLHAAVGSSRASCDLGWYPPSQQVGLTGTVVSPTLYVAIAISGASQHIAGCGGSKNIVAINKDPDANIFRYCRFGIVDDYKKILPPLEEAIKKAVAGG